MIDRHPTASRMAGRSERGSRRSGRLLHPERVQHLLEHVELLGPPGWIDGAPGLVPGVRGNTRGWSPVVVEDVHDLVGPTRLDEGGVHVQVAVQSIDRYALFVRDGL